jgi:cob(I)alamin adenosyltransferase
MTSDVESHVSATRYGRESDLGRTELGDVGRVSKGDIRLEAFAAVEEANTALGHALAMGGYAPEVGQTLTALQNDLFDLAADLLAPMDQDLDPEPVRIEEAHLTWVERAAAHYRSDLEQVDGFVLPGGTVAASFLYQARVAVRSAERAVIKAMEEHPEALNPRTARYLNSVSTLLFVLARSHNGEHGDLIWRPHATITPPAGDTA